MREYFIVLHIIYDITIALNLWGMLSLKIQVDTLDNR